MAWPGRSSRPSPSTSPPRSANADDGQQLGWALRELAAQLAGELDAGRAWSAVVLREQRPSPRDPRSGLTMLLARAPAVQLSPRTGRR